MSKSIYQKIWEDYTGLKKPRGWHIHHVDGNPDNNDPNNLICVSPYVHWCIHFLQGDVVALNGKFIQGAVEAGRKGGAKSKGRKRTPESIEKHRQKMIGRPELGWSKGMKFPFNEKRSRSMKGHKWTPEQNEKRRQSVRRYYERIRESASVS